MRALAVMLAALCLSLAAGLNGQPFFHPDTIGYTRGPDVAVMKLLGPRFASSWAKTSEGPAARATAPAGAKAAASYDDNEVMGGRSIYYGVLAYLGALVGGFWLTVFVQGLAVAMLVEIAMRGLRIMGLATYAAVMALLTLATPAPFFVGFVMPDIWAAVAIGGLSVSLALSRRLTRIDLSALAAMTAFGALAHNSVVPVLAVITVVGAGWWLLKRETAPDARPGLAIGTAAIVIALAGGLAFSAMVKHAVGKPPVTPPFLTARVIADGPGARYAREHCAGQSFTVCRFADRLPMGVDNFLWGAGIDDGVFQTAPTAERRSMAEQDARFALTAAAAYPVQQIAASARNAALQTVDTDLGDFNYNGHVRADFAATLPAAPRAAMASTLAYRQAWPLQGIWVLQSVVLLASLLAIGVMAVRAPKGSAALLEPSDALLLAALIIVGVLANGVVCGVLSTLYGRYQARVVWLIPLAAALLALVQARSQERSVRLR